MHFGVGYHSSNYDDDVIPNYKWMSMDHIWVGKALVLDKLMVLGNLRHWLVLINPLAV